MLPRKVKDSNMRLWADESGGFGTHRPGYLVKEISDGSASRRQKGNPLMTVLLDHPKGQVQINYDVLMKFSGPGVKALANATIASLGLEVNYDLIAKDKVRTRSANTKHRKGGAIGDEVQPMPKGYCADISPFAFGFVKEAIANSKFNSDF